MNQSTLLKILLAGTVLVILISWPAFAQHGGAHGGGGGGMHSGGGGSGRGGFHGGGYGGGYHGGPSGGYSGHGPYAGPRGATGSSGAAHPWSWEGHSSRDISPGWHQFASGNTGSMARSAAASSGPRSTSHPGSGQSGPAAMHHAPIADGQWHSFAGRSTQVARATVLTSGSRVAVVSTGVAWRGNWGVWRGGWGWGWPGWNWGWGWGCCGWGWGWGFGFGFGWGAWAPFWAWPPYWYSPWLGAAAAPTYVLDPHPA